MLNGNQVKNEVNLRSSLTTWLTLKCLHTSRWQFKAKMQNTRVTKCNWCTVMSVKFAELHLPASSTIFSVAKQLWALLYFLCFCGFFQLPNGPAGIEVGTAAAVFMEKSSYTFLLIFALIWSTFSAFKAKTVLLVMQSLVYLQRCRSPCVHCAAGEQHLTLNPQSSLKAPHFSFSLNCGLKKKAVQCWTIL